MDDSSELDRTSQRRLARQARQREKIRARREQRVTYDLPPRIRQRIKELADEQRIPASQIVALALARFLRELEEDKVDLSPFKQPSRSPRYDWNLVLPDRLLPRRRRKGRGAVGSEQ
ncbi:MAG TPA: hypothetical protein VFF68_06270 [Anaerolineaceae bacterium]|nr:hypothetical protein [Anaerolineaceae bacterium]